MIKKELNGRSLRLSFIGKNSRVDRDTEDELEKIVVNELDGIEDLCVEAGKYEAQLSQVGKGYPDKTYQKYHS